MSDAHEGYSAEIKSLGLNCTEVEESVNREDASNTETAYVSKIALNQEFHSFVELRAAIEKYQKERSVQLIVKDSKLLEAESTRKVIPKVYHLVNQKLMYHSITYCCKCHGQLKRKPNSRIRNAGAKRLNCPMYFRLRLSPDLQKLVIFDMREEHNHAIDPNTCQMAPRQQVYTFSRLRKDTEKVSDSQEDIASLLATTTTIIKEEFAEPEEKQMKLDDENVEENVTSVDSQKATRFRDPHLSLPTDNSDSPLDSDSSSSDDSDEDDFCHVMRRHAMRCNLLSFPIRLIGSAIKSSPELIEASKQLIEMQKTNLILEKKKLMLTTRNLELENVKLELEVKMMEKNENEAVQHNPDTTIYLHTS